MTLLAAIILSLPTPAAHHTSFYMQRLNDPDVDPAMRLQYADSLLSDKHNVNTDSLLRLKIKWAYQLGDYDAVIGAYDSLGDKIAESGISTECSLRIDYIRSLRSKKQYVRSMALCHELMRLDKPDSLIYYDALALATIHDFIRQSNIPFNEDYVKNVVMILEKASEKRLPQYSLDRIRHALHSMRMKKAITEKNYDMALQQADSLLKIPMIENEKESLEANIAFVYMLIGQYDAAENYFKKLLESGKPSYNNGICLMNYTHMLNLQGRYRESLELIDKYEYMAKSLNRDIFYSHLLGNRAIAESNTSGFEKAFRTLLENKEIEDSLFFNSNIQDGLLLFDYTGKTEKIDELERSLDGSRSSARALGVVSLILFSAVCVATGILWRLNRERKSLRNTLSSCVAKIEAMEKDQARMSESESGKVAAQLLQFARLEEAISSIGEITATKGKSSDDKVRLINELLTASKVGTDTREIFEQQFEQAHSLFFKKLYGAHPDLSPGEARMCAYLIMNLSSKEIAAITNKTTRSVEATRYRIGKKFNLPEGKTLTVYLREFL